MRRTALFLLLSTLTACGLFDQCTPGERRCDAGVIEECSTHPSGVDLSADPPSASHHDSSPNTWDARGSCGQPELCQTEQAPDSHGVVKASAFCSLSAAPEPACAGVAGACEGTALISCHGGFAIERELCRSCDGTQRCEGGVHDVCAQTADCAAGLTCVSQGCEMPCTCAEGAACETCNVLDTRTAGPTRPSPFTWICASGRCFEKYQ